MDFDPAHIARTGVVRKGLPGCRDESYGCTAGDHLGGVGGGHVITIPYETDAVKAFGPKSSKNL